MICPVCENEQERGARCAVCGRALTGEHAVDERVKPLEGLEPTRLEVPHVPGGPTVVGLEPSGIGGIVLGGDGPPAPCGYCGTPTVRGAVFCPTCGLRLPVYRSAQRQAPDEIRCERCAGYVRNGTCSLCGAHVSPGA